MSAELLRECECGCGSPAPLARQTDARRGYRKGQPIRFVKGHNARLWTSRNAEVRFWEKTRLAAGGCIEWTAARSGQGYGRFAPYQSRTISAHRFAYELANGSIPVGLHIDHVCHNRACVNADHLEAVTPQENARRSHPAVVSNRCFRGHEFTPENTRVTKHGHRQCRACARLREKRSRRVG